MKNPRIINYREIKKEFSLNEIFRITEVIKLDYGSSEYENDSLNNLRMSKDNYIPANNSLSLSGNNFIDENVIKSILGYIFRMTDNLLTTVILLWGIPWCHGRVSDISCKTPGINNYFPAYIMGFMNKLSRLSNNLIAFAYFTGTFPGNFRKLAGFTGSIGTDIGNTPYINRVIPKNLRDFPVIIVKFTAVIRIISASLRRSYTEELNISMFIRRSPAIAGTLAAIYGG